jgi:hypothetical protein
MVEPWEERNRLDSYVWFSVSDDDHLAVLVYSRTLSISWVEDEFTKESNRGAPGDMCVGSVEEMTKV